MQNQGFLVEYCKHMLAEGKDLESVIGFLRKYGCSKTQSIVILKYLHGISLNKVKSLVYFSQQWQDVIKIDAKIQEQFYDVLMTDNIQK